jgi:hypothetical protein
VGDCLSRAGLVLAAACLAPGCRLIDAAADDDDPAAAADAAACDPVPLVSDDFEDGLIDPAWTSYSDEGTTLEEADGVLRVAFSGDAEAWAGYLTVERHDLRGGSLGAEIRQVGGMTILELGSGNVRIQTYADLATLHATVMVDAETVTSFETDYVADVHVHWRMREQEGRIHWETSADGTTWTELDARPAPLPLDDVSIVVSGGGDVSDAATEFEAVNIEVADPDCAPATLL